MLLFRTKWLVQFPVQQMLLIKLIDGDGRFNMPLVLVNWQRHSHSFPLIPQPISEDLNN